MDILDEIDEAIAWVENEYGFVTDVLRKAQKEIKRLRRPPPTKAEAEIEVETPHRS